MESGEETVPCGYCAQSFLASEASSHIDHCEPRRSSWFYSYLELVWKSFTGTNLDRFVELELEYELKRIRDQRLASKSLPRFAEPGGRSPEKRFRVVMYKNCQMCNRSSNTIKLECAHTFCVSHFKDEVERFKAELAMDCFACNKQLLHPELKKVYGEAIVEEAFLRAAVPPGCEIARCKRCDNVGAVEPAEIDYEVKDSKGRKYSPEAAQSYARYRFLCPKCNNSQCAKCSVLPYHEGMTCEQNMIAKCRYCEDRPCVAEDCCDSPECMQVLETSCRRKLPCGHRCFGIANESECPVCLEPGCSLGQVSGSEYCSICGTEKFSNRPIVRLNCDHISHHSCLEKMLKGRWPTARITFNFAKCQLCFEWALPVSVPELRELVDKYSSLYRDIRDRGLERLRREPEENKRIDDPRDKVYYHKKEKYIMDRFCYYECFRCKGVYFGGKKECEAGEERPQNPEEFLCSTCISRSSSSEFNPICSTHPTDFVEYKCRFCCNLAVFFCWGTTHFCDDCHKRQNAGEYMNEKKLDELPACNRAKCPLGGRHPPAGKEFVVGCGLCRRGER